MQIYHPDHGILILSDRTEIKKLLENGGSVFDINNKPWIKKNESKETTKTNEANEKTEVLNIPKRGIPFKHGD